ncbi:triose-phosphate isomerase [Buchnera aphidicola (Ceratovacuna keduensis)]|uniref:triose-phosphate isomerase n=1 Tax=Buchnera aphidicola TaxID=9 RepID=UPI0031B7FC87
MLILCNWKLNGKKNILKKFFVELNNLCIKFKIKSNISISPPIIYLSKLYEILKDIKSKIILTSQNVDVHIQGAFTGETSVYMLKEFNVKYVIVGHSERRIHHFESDEIVSSKFDIVKKNGLIPILCIGEHFQESFDKSKIFIKNQIDSIFIKIGKKAFRNSIIAYEPVWAIGSGISADPNYVNDIHFLIKSYICKKDNFFKNNNIVVQYGGSISKNNVYNFISKKYIDGILIGGASLEIKTLFPIIKIIEKFSK